MNSTVSAHPQSSLSRDELVKLLDEHGLKPTQQRLVVAEILMAQPTHMTADQILSTLRVSGEHISKATVYNTLNALVACGLIREIHVDPERSVYDSTRSSHHHFYDAESGTLWDINPEEVAISQLPPLPADMEAAGIDVVIRVKRKQTADHPA